MIIHALNMPESTGELAQWLELQLAGPALDELVAELRSVEAELPISAPGLNDVLAGDRQELLERGLSALSRDQLCRLLAHPRLLIELQDAVFAEGGPYWLKLLIDPATDRAAQSAWPEMQRRIAPVVPSKKRHRVMLASIAALATAAAIVAAVVPERLAPPSIAWGWAKSGALDQETNRREYLSRLASGAQEWFQVQPTSRPELQRRIHDFKVGCELLLAAEHRPLDQADRQWLQERCRKWLAVFDQQLSDLNDERHDVAAVRQEMDKTVANLIDAIEKRRDQST